MFIILNMGGLDLQDAEDLEFDPLRFYCNNNKDCQIAEKALSDAKIFYKKIESDGQVPTLITEQRSCRTLQEVLSYVAAVSAIKDNYSVHWR